jgi:hypothetical protein
MGYKEKLIENNCYSTNCSRLNTTINVSKISLTVHLMILQPLDMPINWSRNGAGMESIGVTLHPSKNT